MMTASQYIAIEIAKDCPKIPVDQIAGLLVSLACELWKCKSVDSYVDAAEWCRGVMEKDGRRRRAINEIGRRWRGRLTHYDQLEQSVLRRASIISNDEMRGLFSEIKF